MYLNRSRGSALCYEVVHAASKASQIHNFYPRGCKYSQLSASAVFKAEDTVYRLQ
jgi:hypothetical protein